MIEFILNQVILIKLHKYIIKLKIIHVDLHKYAGINDRIYSKPGDIDETA